MLIVPSRVSTRFPTFGQHNYIWYVSLSKMLSGYLVPTISGINYLTLLDQLSYQNTTFSCLIMSEHSLSVIN